MVWLHSPLRRKRNGVWYDLDSNETVDLKDLWLDGQPDGKEFQKCITYNLETGRHADDGCSVKGCFACSWISEPLFKLRGLCKNSEIANEYVLLPNKTYDETVFFLGLGETNILFRKDMNSWLIVKDKLSDLIKGNITTMPTNILGVFQPDKLSNRMPIGTHSWNLTDEECKGNISLKLTGVSISFLVMGHVGF